MTTFASESFEGGTAGATVTTSNTSASVVTGTPTFALGAYAGTLCMDVSVGGTASICSARFPYAAAQGAVYHCFALKVPTAIPANNCFISSHRNASTAQGDLRIAGGTGTLVLRNGASAVYTTTVALSTGVWYVVEVHIDSVGGTQRLKLWNAAGALIEDSADVAYSGLAIDNVVLGSTTSVANVEVQIDRLQDADVSVGPLSSGSPGRTSTTLVAELNRLANGGAYPAGSAYLGEDGAANKWAGTTGLATLGALNAKQGNALPNYYDLDGVCNQLAGTEGLGATEALRRIDA